MCGGRTEAPTLGLGHVEVTSGEGRCRRGIRSAGPDDPEMTPCRAGELPLGFYDVKVQGDQTSTFWAAGGWRGQREQKEGRGVDGRQDKARLLKIEKDQPTCADRLLRTGDVGQTGRPCGLSVLGRPEGGAQTQGACRCSQRGWTLDPQRSSICPSGCQQARPAHPAQQPPAVTVPPRSAGSTSRAKCAAEPHPRPP